VQNEDYQSWWRQEAQRLSWDQAFNEVHDGRFAEANWFIGGSINASVNCLDRHLKNGGGHKTAIVWENEAGHTRRLNYQELFDLTCNIASMLHESGIRAGDTVAIYMPMTPEAIASMLACARLGAIHTVIFGGFAKEALIDRINDAQAKAIITAPHTIRKGNLIELCDVVLEAVKDHRTDSITTVLCFGGEKSRPIDSRLVYFRPSNHWPDIVIKPTSFDAQHPLFILYTSGTTGKPKGLWHAVGGYLTQVVSTMKWVFEPTDHDLYWCTADVGWITGHSYVTYGPLALGKQIFIFEGALNYPSPQRIYQLIDKHKISILYTAPTAIRMFMAAGKEHAKDFDLSSLRLLGTVGEPINPSAWNWYAQIFGRNRCEVIDSWWQTETGAMMIVAIPGRNKTKAGSASCPFPGISAKVVDEHGQECPKTQAGYLIIDRPWPALARGIWEDQRRYFENYFEKLPGVYFTGDGAKLDEDGDFFISGRIDDVVNVSGHRLGTAEIESALVSHESVAEAAVVGINDDITGQRLIAFVTLVNDTKPSEDLLNQIKDHVKHSIGSFARPAVINFSTALPKTRSGKIMRRLLRSLASGEKVNSDISSLEDQTFLPLK